MGGDGTNTPITGVDFTSGTINLAKGLTFYEDTLFTVAGPAEIRLTDVDYNAGNVTLTFDSEPGKTYKVNRSFNLEGFPDEVMTGIVSGGASTTTTPIAASEAAAYYVVSEE